MIPKKIFCFFLYGIVGLITSFNFAFPSDIMSDLEAIGKPIPNGTGFQPPVTEVAKDIQWLDNILLVFVLLTSLFVFALILVVVVKYNRKTNPIPATFTHNTKIEIAWTVIPIIILLAIGTFSLPILFKQLDIPESDLTIKATGNQWYWNYKYPEHGIEFDAFMLEKDKLAEYGYKKDEYLLATDYPVVVPVNKVVRIQVAGGDVIHAWKIPAFGVHMDAVPGRLNETWFKAEKEGIYFGQCSELCGKNHAYMPIVVKVVSEKVYDEWLNGAIEEFASAETFSVASR